MISGCRIIPQSRYLQKRFVGSSGGNRILTNNDPCSAPLFRALLVGWLAAKVYSGTGADIVMESITF
jgi:hypothetical protein